MAAPFIYFDGAQEELGLVPVESSPVEAVGAAAGVATAASSVVGIAQFSGTEAGVAVVSSSFTATGQVTGSVVGLASVSSTLEAFASLTGDAQGIASVAAIILRIAPVNPVVPVPHADRQVHPGRLYWMRMNNGDLIGPYYMTEIDKIARRMSTARYGSYFVEVFKYLTSTLGFPDELQGQYKLHAVYINGQKKASGQAAKQLSKFHLGVDR